MQLRKQARYIEPMCRFMYLRRTTCTLAKSGRGYIWPKPKIKPKQERSVNATRFLILSKNQRIPKQTQRSISVGFYFGKKTRDEKNLWQYCQIPQHGRLQFRSALQTLELVDIPSSTASSVSVRNLLSVLQCWSQQPNFTVKTHIFWTEHPKLTYRQMYHQVVCFYQEILHHFKVSQHFRHEKLVIS